MLFRTFKQLVESLTIVCHMFQVQLTRMKYVHQSAKTMNPLRDTNAKMWLYLKVLPRLRLLSSNLDLLKQLLLFMEIFSPTKLESTTTSLVMKLAAMLSKLLVGDKKAVLTTGLLLTLGDPNGVKMATSE